MILKIADLIKTVLGLSPQQDAGPTAVTGSIVDRLGYQGAVVTHVTGAISGTPTSTSVAVKVQHSDADDGTGFTDISGATAVVTTADTATEIDLNLAGCKRYIRVVSTTTFVDGTTPKVFIAATISLGEAGEYPV